MNRKLYESYCRAYQATFRLAVNVLDWTEPKLIKGAGAVRELPKTVKELGYNNVLVVTDRGLMGLHLLDSLFEELKNNDIAYIVYDGVQPNPTIGNLLKNLKNSSHLGDFCVGSCDSCAASLGAVHG